jgi:outer membrane receptor protein involved in Fe transport
VEGTYHDSKVRALDLISSDSAFSIPDSLGLQNANSLDVSLYAQDEWKVSDRLSVNLGGRVTWFEKGNYLYAEPRVSAAFRLNDYATLTGSYTEAHQPVHLVIRNSLSLPTDTWFPATEKIFPGFARQGSLGVQGSLDAGTWDWSVEGYYKDLDNL